MRWMNPFACLCAASRLAKKEALSLSVGKDRCRAPFWWWPHAHHKTHRERTVLVVWCHSVVCGAHGGGRREALPFLFSRAKRVPPPVATRAALFWGLAHLLLLVSWLGHQAHPTPPPPPHTGLHPMPSCSYTPLLDERRSGSSGWGLSHALWTPCGQAKRSTSRSATDLFFQNCLCATIPLFLLTHAPHPRTPHTPHRRSNTSHGRLGPSNEYLHVGRGKRRENKPTHPMAMSWHTHASPSCYP